MSWRESLFDPTENTEWHGVDKSTFVVLLWRQEQHTGHMMLMIDARRNGEDGDWENIMKENGQSTAITLRFTVLCLEC